MGDEQPKYLNSPETPAYIKGRHLYGLFQSKEAIRQKKFAILVEGYLDLIALYQFGVTNVAASLGTAFTPEQSKLLSRFTKKVVINYDGDDAGIKAAKRAIEHLLPQDFEIKVLVLPDGQDPDDFVRKNGAESYNEARGRAATFLNFLLDASLKDRSLGNPKQKAEAIEEVMPLISAIKNPIQKRESFDLSMNYYRVEDAGLKRDLWLTIKGGSRAEPTVVQKQVRRATQAKITVAEQHLLELILHDDELRERVLELLEETDYETLATAPIFTALYELAKKRVTPTIDNLLKIVGGDEYFDDLVPVLMMSEPKRSAGDVIDYVLHDAENCIFTLRSMAIENRINDVNRELIAAEQARDQVALGELVAEQIELAKIRRFLLNKIAQT